MDVGALPTGPRDLFFAGYQSFLVLLMVFFFLGWLSDNVRLVFPPKVRREGRSMAGSVLADVVGYPVNAFGIAEKSGVGPNAFDFVNNLAIPI